MRKLNDSFIYLEMFQLQECISEVGSDIVKLSKIGGKEKSKLLKGNANISSIG